MSTAEMMAMILKAVSLVVRQKISAREALMMIGWKILPETRKVEEEGKLYIADFHSFLSGVLKEPRLCGPKGGEAKKELAEVCD